MSLTEKIQTRGKKFLRKLTQCRDGPVKSTVKGRDENTRKLHYNGKTRKKRQDDYSTSVAYKSGMKPREDYTTTEKLWKRRT